jgi:hypothetical protein
VSEVLTMSRSVLKYTNLENGQVPLSIPPTANENFFFEVGSVLPHLQVDGNINFCYDGCEIILCNSE